MVLAPLSLYDIRIIHLNYKLLLGNTSDNFTILIHSVSLLLAPQCKPREGIHKYCCSFNDFSALTISCNSSVSPVNVRELIFYRWDNLAIQYSGGPWYLNNIWGTLPTRKLETDPREKCVYPDNQLGFSAESILVDIWITASSTCDRSLRYVGSSIFCGVCNQDNHLGANCILFGQTSICEKYLRITQGCII